MTHQETKKLLHDSASKRVVVPDRRGIKIWFFILVIGMITALTLVLILDFSNDIKIAIGITTIAGCAALIGGLSIFCVKKETLSIIPISLSFSAGVIIYLCLLNLIPESIHEFEKVTKDNEGLSHLYCSLCVFAGIMITMLMEYAFSKYDVDTHNHDDAQMIIEMARYTEDNKHDTDGIPSSSDLSTLSYSVAIALILHHFPEGIATFVSLYYDFQFGALVAFALSVHDIPSGICIAVPVYISTGSKILPFFLCFIAAITYPIGAFVGWAIIETTSDQFIETLNGILFGVTGGIMLYISFIELLPVALQTANHYAKQQKSQSVNMVTISYVLLFIGFLVMDICNIILKFAE